MKGFKVGRSILPRRLTQGIDDKWDNDHHDAPDDKHGIPHRLAAHGNLTGRDEAEDEGQERTEEAQATDKPHQPVTLATDTEGAIGLLHAIAQVDGCSKHQQVHDKVEQHGELREYLIEALHRGHHHEE